MKLVVHMGQTVKCCSIVNTGLRNNHCSYMKFVKGQCPPVAVALIWM